ncbi:MAG: efflux RND transporter permease subunit [Rhodovibrio sp.]|nr:efflux RND transporter permease subunit [Rhodovibrio sp.]
MTLSDRALKQPHVVAALVVLVAVWGVLAYLRTPVDLFPDTAPPQVAVIATQPGASARDVTDNITQVLEKEFNSLGGVETITSTSRDGVAAITVEFQYGRTAGAAVTAVSNAIDRVAQDLPADMPPPEVHAVTDATQSVLTLALRPAAESPKRLADVRLLAENVLKDRFLALPAVGDVEVFGGHQREVRVAVDSRALAARGIPLERVVSVLKAANVTVPGGEVSRGDSETLVTVSGQLPGLDAIRDLPLAAHGNGTTRIGDVATVERTIADQRAAFHGNAEPAIAINIMRPLDGASLAAIQAAKDLLPELRAQYKDIRFEIAGSQEGIIDANASGLRNSLLQAVVLTVAVIFLFLADLRVAAIAATSIPLAFLGAFAVLGFLPYSLNMVTMSGLIIAVGMVVDSAVVVIENIVRRQREGDDNPAQEGTRQVALAVTAGMLTTVVVVAPVMVAGGYLQQVMRPLNLMISATLIGSLLVALTVIPPLAARFLGPGRTRGRLERQLDRVSQAVDRLGDLVAAGVRRMLRRRWLVVAVAVAFLVATMRLVPPLIGNELMPPMDTGIATIDLEVPASATPAHTQEIVREVEQRVWETPGVTRTATTIGAEPGKLSFGGSGATPQSAEITVYMVPRTERAQSIWTIMAGWRTYLEQHPGVKGQTVLEYGATPMATTKAPLDIIVSGPDPRTLDRLGDRVTAALEGMPGIVDVRRSWFRDKPERRIVVDRERARRLGLDARTVGQAVQAAVNGQPAGDLRLQGYLDEPIRVAYANAQVNRPGGVGDIYLPTDGSRVPLRAVTRSSVHDIQPIITRENLRATLDITAVNKTLTIAQVAARAQARLAGIALPSGYSVEVGGTITDLRTNQGNMRAALIPGVLMLGLLLFALFRSVRHALTVLAVVPLAVAAGLWGLLGFGKPMCMPAIMGLILLVGTVVNNQILLLDFILQARRDGIARTEAVVRAVRLRVRPVLMTTLSTVLGLSPLIFEMAVGLERMSPLGIAAASGLLAGMVVTFGVVPVVYTLLDDLPVLARAVGRGRPTASRRAS